MTDTKPVVTAPELEMKPAAKADDKPTTVEVVIGDKKVAVDPAIAKELEAARKAAQDAGVSATQLRGQLTELASKVDLLTKPAKQDSGVDIETLLFTNPKEALKIVRDEVRADVMKEVNQTNAQAEFWQEFYRQNNDLRDFDGYVRFIFSREYQGYSKSNLSVGDVMKKLGETVKGDLIKMAPKGGGTGKPVAEGGNEAGNRGESGESKSTDSGDSQTSTASILSERRAARREAMQPGKRQSK